MISTNIAAYTLRLGCERERERERECEREFGCE